LQSAIEVQGRFRELRERAVALLGFRAVPVFITRSSSCAHGVEDNIEWHGTSVLLCNMQSGTLAET
jgi:hypothetical protein